MWKMYKKPTEDRIAVAPRDDNFEWILGQVFDSNHEFKSIIKSQVNILLQI
jgi:hypothetical protein